MAKGRPAAESNSYAESYCFAQFDTNSYTDFQPDGYSDNHAHRYSKLHTGTAVNHLPAHQQVRKRGKDCYIYGYRHRRRAVNLPMAKERG
jgi:hypothetical protein